MSDLKERTQGSKIEWLTHQVALLTGKVTELERQNNWLVNWLVKKIMQHDVAIIELEREALESRQPAPRSVWVCEHGENVGGSRCPLCQPAPEEARDE